MGPADERPAPKALWFSVPPTELAWVAHSGLAPYLGIELSAAGADFVSGRMPVDDRTRQPFGLLHGGASVVLAETLASVASAAIIDPARQRCVGLEINANHVRGVSQGWVTGTARPMHIGRGTHVWDIRIVDERQRLVCVSRCTIAILDHPAKSKPDPSSA